MKRSKINDIIRNAGHFMKSFNVVLPPFSRWTPRELADRNPSRIVDAGLGWDVTDYGLDNFEQTGLFLFTMRNGSVNNLVNGRGMIYAEKIMISRKNQLAPMHRHLLKTEDIINRGGGKLVLELFMADRAGDIDHSAQVEVICDGINRKLPAGGLLKLDPGESVTLEPGVWHAFWAEEADVLIGEVSSVNDDRTDNVFADPLVRFCTIEEDQPPLHLLVSDYEKWISGSSVR